MLLSRLVRPLARLRAPTRASSHFCTSSSTEPPPSLERTILNLRVDPASIPPVLRSAISLQNASRSEKRRARKVDIVERFRRSDADTGSPEVQIALWTDRIQDLTAHVQMHKQDKASRRRLVMMVNKRRRMLRYLLREDSGRYGEVVSCLGLRRGTVFGKEMRKGAKNAPTRVIL